MKRVLERSEHGQIEGYKQKLLERKTQVLSNLGAKFDARAAMGRVAEEDQAQISHDEFISLSLNSLDYEQLGLVEEALDRIAVGDYGLCLSCGEPIPGKRLRAVPWARYCVSCQERQNVFRSSEAEPTGSASDR